MASLLESDMADKTVNEGGSFLRLSPPIYLLAMARAGVFAMFLLH
jgi:hypothetical protein